MSTPIPKCPQCNKKLEKVTRDTGSYLNQDQFDAVRAGDWYCASCTGNEARTGFKYWWNRELDQ
jgi:uncharacterized protein with PIN domain